MKNSKGNKFSNILKLMLMALAVGGFLKIAYMQHMKLNDIKGQISSTDKQIVDAQKQKQEYLSQKKIINSRAYIERVARDKYNMVKPGDKIFIISR